MPRDRAKMSYRFHIFATCFFLPLELLEEIGGPIPQIAGTKIACNFYKVCEGGNAEQIQYASYSPVDVPEPDFHRPEFFETGELQ